MTKAPSRSPSFFVIGAQRAGTTRLCHLLDRHPQVTIPTKEPFFFQSVDAMLEKRSWYESLFANLPAGQVAGEGSTYYSMCAKYPGTAARIYAFNPEARLIYMARHPLRRIESAWHHLRSVRQISGLTSFKKALETCDELIEPTLYSKQVGEYLRYFTPQQVRVSFFEDFVGDEANVVGDCLSFLGLDPSRLAPPHDDNANLNASHEKIADWVGLDAVRVVPGYRHLKRLIPQQLKTVATERLRRPVDVTNPWDEPSLAYVRERIEEDTRTFLGRFGQGRIVWRLDG